VAWIFQPKYSAWHGTASTHAKRSARAVGDSGNGAPVAESSMTMVRKRLVEDADQELDEDGILGGQLTSQSPHIDHN
jgi:hypothetical protein